MVKGVHAYWEILNDKEVYFVSKMKSFWVVPPFSHLATGLWHSSLSVYSHHVSCALLTVTEYPE